MAPRCFDGVDAARVAVHDGLAERGTSVALPVKPRRTRPLSRASRGRLEPFEMPGVPGYVDSDYRALAAAGHRRYREIVQYTAVDE